MGLESPRSLPDPGGPAFVFGPFRLSVAERRLERDGVPVKLGAKAFDILAVLVEHAGAPVSKALLATRVWPGVVVGESSLRFQIVGLRRLLGDGPGGERWIVTLPGRGYCFVAPVTRVGGRALPVTPAMAQGRLPPRLARMLGRDSSLAAVRAQLDRSRFVTIVGPGGIGKTTLAVAVAHGVPGRVCFVDLGAVADPGLVPGAVATALGLPVRDADPAPDLVAFLADERLLVVLDSCEHVVAAAAGLAESLFQSAPGIRLLATSREALRVEGETVYPLEPFAYPEEGAALSVEALLAYPAARLFLERAAASGAPLRPGTEDAPVIAEICRRLDGIALALELAAGCVPTYGLRGTAALLHDRFAHLHSGRRTAVPRHQTLAGTLAWSFGLLDGRARRVLRRLAVFAGVFTLEAACAVVADGTLSEGDAIEAVADLVAKSLLSARRAGDAVTYRLLDTTRAFLLEAPVDPEEWAAVQRRRAEHFLALVARPDADAAARRSDIDAGVVSNLRAALDWCFGPDGDRALGTALAAAAAPLYLRLSLLTECHRISEIAVAALDGDALGSRAEMELQASLGVAAMYTSGHPPRVEMALERALELAGRLGEPQRRLRILGELHILHMRTARCAKALHAAERAAAAAAAIGGEADAAAQLLLGIALHIVGRNDEAHERLADGLQRSRPGIGGFSFDLLSRGRIVLARSLWIRGWPEQAAASAREAVAESAARGDPVVGSIALAGAASVFLWRRDLDAAERCIGRLVAHAERHALRPYRAVAAGFEGELAIRAGRVADGVERIAAALDAQSAVSYGLAATEARLALAEGLALLGRRDRALAAVAACARQMEHDGDALYAPELLRLEAVIHAGTPSGGRRAERLLRESIALARDQAARSWELRSAASLAGMLARTGRAAEVTPLLEPILARFAEGFDTPDLLAARRLLDGGA